MFVHQPMFALENRGIKWIQQHFNLLKKSPLQHCFDVCGLLAAELTQGSHLLALCMFHRTSNVPFQILWYAYKCHPIYHKDPYNMPVSIELCKTEEVVSIPIGSLGIFRKMFHEYT